MTECFMYGDWTGERGPPEPIKTVLLIGYDGRRKVLTGTHRELWREFLRGDGGPGTRGVQPCGWEYWCPQPLGVREHEALPTPSVQSLLDRGK